MIWRRMAIVGLSLVGLVGTSGAANATYAPPEIPVIDMPADGSEIEPGEPVPVFMAEFMAASSATLAVSRAGVDGAIGLTVPGSAINAAVGPTGRFGIDVIFHEPAVYTMTATGLDEDGTPKTVSMTLSIQPATSGGGDGGDGNGNGGNGAGGNGNSGGLPNTGFSSLSAILAGAGLAGLGAGIIFLSRRRTPEMASTDA